VTTTITEVFTSYSIGKNEKPTGYLSTATFTIISTPTIEPTRAPVAHRLEPRKKMADVAYKWMFHPWSRSVLCYECYTNKPGNWKWVKCNSGPNHEEACSDRQVDADGFPYTTTTTQTNLAVTSTQTTYTTDATSTVTTTTHSTLASPLSASLAARSWHKDVHFRHPWTGQRVCADAEWEKRGRPNFEIRLQDVHIDDGNDCTGAESLDVPDRLIETVTTTSTSTQTISVASYTVWSTVTVTYRVHVSTTTFPPDHSILNSHTPSPGLTLLQPGELSTTVLSTTVLSTTVLSTTVLPSVVLPNVVFPTGGVGDAGKPAAAPTHTDL
jgi:hypothetical protein